jgi:hypothetical protein
MIRALEAAALLVVVALGGCGGPAPHSTSPGPSSSHTPAASATPSVSPSSAPDDETVTQVASGFGAYDLQVYPIALLTNEATSHTATGVIVRFTVQLSGGTYALSAEPVSLAPGQTLAVTALCTESCEGATGIEAAVTVGGWTAVISAGTGAYACGSPCAGTTGYEGDVSGTLNGGIPDETLINVSAACTDGSGAIVGGGLIQTVWSDGSSASVSVPVLVSVPPASCQLYGTEVS